MCLLIADSGTIVFASPNENALPPGLSPAVSRKFKTALELTMSGKDSEAAAMYAEICKLAPTFALAHQQYGAILLGLDKVKEAEAELLKANTLRPGMSFTLLALGSVFERQSRNKEALAKYIQYLKVAPEAENASEIAERINILKVEIKRNQGAESSLGKDNYLSEAVSVGATRWFPSAMPLTIFIDSGNQVKSYRSEFTTIFKKAFDDWIEASQGKIRIKIADSPTVASIVCRWLDDPNKLVNPIDGGDANSSVDESGALNRSRIMLLTEANGLPLTNDLMRGLCLHEIGHALGIQGHSSQQGDVMTASYDFKHPNANLSERDKKTLLELYAAPNAFLAEHKMKNDIAADSKSPIGIALKLNEKARAEINSAHYADALKLLLQAIKLDPDAHFVQFNIARCYKELGYANWNSGDYAGADKNLDMSADWALKCGEKHAAAAMYQDLIELARHLGHEADAIKYESKAKCIISAPELTQTTEFVPGKASVGESSQTPELLPGKLPLAESSQTPELAPRKGPAPELAHTPGSAHRLTTAHAHASTPEEMLLNHFQLMAKGDDRSMKLAYADLGSKWQARQSLHDFMSGQGKWFVKGNPIDSITNVKMFSADLAEVVVNMSNFSSSNLSLRFTLGKEGNGWKILKGVPLRD